MGWNLGRPLTLSRRPWILLGAGEQHSVGQELQLLPWAGHYYCVHLRGCLRTNGAATERMARGEKLVLLAAG